MLKNPIPKSNMFHNPESLAELFDRIESFSNKKEKAQAYQIAMMTLNACSTVVDKMIDEQALNAIDSMFGGGNPADKLSIRKKV
jgi:hypothetical protein